MVMSICLSGIGTVFQALGYSFYSMIISLIRQLGVLIPSAFVIGILTKDVTSIWWSFVIAEGFSLLLSVIFYQKVNREVIETL